MRTCGLGSPRAGTVGDETTMAKYEFKIVSLDRSELRREGSSASNELNGLGSQGWHIVHVKEDPQLGRDLLIFLEREKPD